MLQYSSLLLTSSMVCVGTFTTDDTFVFQNILKQLDNEGITYRTQPGIVSNLLVMPEHEERAHDIIDQTHGTA